MLYIFYKAFLYNIGVNPGLQNLRGQTLGVKTTVVLTCLSSDNRCLRLTSASCLFHLRLGLRFA